MNDIIGRTTPPGKLRGKLTIPELINYGTVNTGEVLYNTVDGWNSQSGLISKAKTIYVYIDYDRDDHDDLIAAFKIGDGNAYLIDLPFYSTVSKEQQEFWNNKVRCYQDPEDPEHLIFTTN